MSSGVPPASSTLSATELIPAQRDHLDIGQVIFVRGRKAVLIDVDFPNLYWTFIGEESIKHRSYLVDPRLFQVPMGTPLRRKDTANSAFDATDSDDDDEAGGRGVQGGSGTVISQEDGVDGNVEFPAFDESSPSNAEVHAFAAEFEDNDGSGRLSTGATAI